MSVVSGTGAAATRLTSCSSIWTRARRKSTSRWTASRWAIIASVFDPTVAVGCEVAAVRPSRLRSAVARAARVWSRLP